MRLVLLRQQYPTCFPVLAPEELLELSVRCATH